MRKKGPYIVWAFFFLVVGRAAFSQDSPAARARTDRDTIQIGQPIQLLLEATVPKGTGVKWFSFDSISHFDFIEKGKLDSLDSAGWTVLRQRFVITSFDSGSRVIPPLQTDIGNKNYTTDSIRIEVSYSPFDPKKDYHDIKDIIDVENPYVKYIAWVIGLLTLVCAALTAYFIKYVRKKEPGKEETVFSSLSPYEEAMQSLGALKKQKLPENGQVKQYYTRLNDILRLFVLRKLQISSMEKTNEELIMQLKTLPLSAAQYTKLAQALRMSDFVKFAKFLPSPDDNENNFTVIETSVQLLNETHT